MSNTSTNNACECTWHRAMRGLENSRLPHDAQRARATAVALAMAYRDTPEGVALLEEVLRSDWSPSYPATITNTIHQCLETPPPSASKLAELAARIRQHITTRRSIAETPNHESVATEDLMLAALADLERYQNAYQSDDDLFSFLQSEP